MAQSSGMELMFVSFTQPNDIKDKATQRRIHQHVMKPIGRARRRKNLTREQQSETTTTATLNQRELDPGHPSPTHPLDNSSKPSLPSPHQLSWMMQDPRACASAIPKPLSYDYDFYSGRAAVRAELVVKYCESQISLLSCPGPLPSLSNDARAWICATDYLLTILC